MDQSDAIVLLYLLKNEGALAKGASLEQCAETFKATQEKLSQMMQKKIGETIIGRMDQGKSMF